MSVLQYWVLLILVQGMLLGPKSNMKINIKVHRGPHEMEYILFLVSLIWTHKLHTLDKVSLGHPEMEFLYSNIVSHSVWRHELYFTTCFVFE